ncbi:MAG: glycosyltransferase family 39 protein [Candidatus Hydrogenedentes bacterium]|nr:glycosyltransferase family 39 protein [Candidatus Hydrogenedentota bacterium]
MPTRKPGRLALTWLAALALLGAAHVQSRAQDAQDLLKHQPPRNAGEPETYYFVSDPNLRLDASELGVLLVNLDLDADPRQVSGKFMWRYADGGWERGGAIGVPVRNGRQTSVIDLTSHPLWNGEVAQIGFFLEAPVGAVRSVSSTGIDLVSRTTLNALRAALQHNFRTTPNAPQVVCGVVLALMALLWWRGWIRWRSFLPHLPFLALFCVYYAFAMRYAIHFAAWNISIDEFPVFDHTLYLLEFGHHRPEGSLDRVALPGFPRGALQVWMTALAMLVFGVNEFAARLPSLVAGACTILLTYAALDRLTGRRTVALLASVVFMLSPTFTSWQFPCRFYALILFLHTAVVLLFYLGFESAPQTWRTASSVQAHAPGRIRRLWNAFKQWCVREELHPPLLIAAGAVFILNLNNFLALGLVVFALAGYGLIMLPIDLALRWRTRRRIAGSPTGNTAAVPPYRFKYAVLALLFLLANALLLIAAQRQGEDWSTGIAALDRLPSLVAELLDGSFQNRNAGQFRWLFPPGQAGYIVLLLGAGAIGFWHYPSRFKYYGVMLAVSYAYLFVCAYFAWQQTSDRYVQFMLAMHVPLLAMGIYTVAERSAACMVWSLRRASRFPAQFSNRIHGQTTVALALVVCALLHANSVASGAYVRDAFWKPWGAVEHEAAAQYVFRHAQAGDLVCYQERKAYYIHRVVDALGLDYDRFRHWDLHWNASVPLSEFLAKLAQDHPQGWLMWTREKSHHIDPAIREVCATYFTGHPATKNKTVVVYSWNREQRDRAVQARNGS